MHTDEIKLRFSGARVRFKLYTPSEAVSCRALFVSGPFGDIESWERLCRLLCEKGVLCVCAELPGFGKCPGNLKTPQNNSARAAMLWGVLDEVELARGENLSGWHLVAHGSACGAIMEMALSHHECVLSRVFINPVTDRFKKLSGIISSRAGSFYLKRAAKLYTSASMFAKKMSKLYGKYPIKRRLNVLFKEYSDYAKASVFKRLICEGYKISDDAFNIEGPLMLIRGKKDVLFSKREEAFIDRLPDIEMHIVNAYHMVYESQPEMTADYLNGWFSFSEGKTKQVFTRKKREKA